MAAPRIESDIATWLQTRFAAGDGVDSSWVGRCTALFNEERITSVNEAFGTLPTSLKIKVLLTLLHLPARLLDECKDDLNGICEQAKSSADSWIATLGELLATFATDRTLDLGVFESRGGLRESLLQVRTSLTPANYRIAVPKRGAKNASAKANAAASSINCCWTSHVPDETSYLHRSVVAQIYGTRVTPSDVAQPPATSSLQNRTSTTTTSAQPHFVLVPNVSASTTSNPSTSPPGAKRKVTRVTRYREQFFERTSTLLSGKAPAGVWMAGSSKLDAFLDSATSAVDRDKTVDRDRKGAAGAARSRESTSSAFLPASRVSRTPSNFGRSDSFGRAGAFNRTASIGANASAAGGTKMIELNEVEALALAKRGSGKRRVVEEQQADAASTKKDGAAGEDSDTEKKTKKSVSKKSKAEPTSTGPQKQSEAASNGAQGSKSLSLTKEQMAAASEMFRSANRIGQAEKEVILGFMAGCTEKPAQLQGDTMTILLNESDESYKFADPDGTEKLTMMRVCTYVQLNFAQHSYQQIKKLKPITQSASGAPQTQPNTAASQNATGVNANSFPQQNTLSHGFAQQDVKTQAFVPHAAGTSAGNPIGQSGRQALSAQGGMPITNFVPQTMRTTAGQQRTGTFANTPLQSNMTGYMYSQPNNAANTGANPTNEFVYASEAFADHAYGSQANSTGHVQSRVK